MSRDLQRALPDPSTDKPMGGTLFSPVWSSRALYRGTVCLLLILLVTRVVRLLTWQHTMDDAYMFVRYADHVIHNGCLCWNVPGQPTYGLTAPAYLALVIPIRLLVPDAPGVAIIASSLVGGALAMALLAVLLAKYVGASSVAGARRLLTLFVLGSLLIGSYPLAFHFTSGMDTTFALAALTALMIGHRQNEQRPGRVLTLALGLASGLIFFVRPDLVIYSVSIAAVGVVAARDAATRRRFGAILGVGVAMLALELLATNRYFGLPLPLPFYAKGMHSYTGRILSVYRYTSYAEYKAFVEHQWPLLVVALPSFVYLVRGRGLSAFTPVELGVGVSTLAFTAYYLFFVLQILPHQARFYFPTVPALYLLAARALVLVLETDAAPVRWLLRAQRTVGEHARLSPRLTASGTALILFGLTGVACYCARQVAAAVAEIRDQRTFDVSVRYAATEWDIWYRLDEISRLPNDLIMGTTEVGILSALNPQKFIIDLAGLNDTAVVRHGFQVDRLLGAARADILYLPHPDYSDMYRAITEDPWFRQNYEVFPAEQLNCTLGLAIRRDGKYFPALHAIALEGPLPRHRMHD